MMVAGKLAVEYFLRKTAAQTRSNYLSIIQHRSRGGYLRLPKPVPNRFFSFSHSWNSRPAVRLVRRVNMAFRTMSRLLLLLAITLLSAIHVSAQTAASSATVTTAPRTTTSASSNSTSTHSRSSAATAGAPPDVYLNVPELHVGRIELTVEKLSADLNLNAKVANLVQLNAGVQVSVEKVNITIAEVDAEVELVVRLGEFRDTTGV